MLYQLKTKREGEDRRRARKYPFEPTLIGSLCIKGNVKNVKKKF